MIQQLGNVNKLCNCLLRSKPWRGLQDWAKLGEGHASRMPPPSHQGRAGYAYSLTGVTFGFCSTHTTGLGLMALCRELQLSKQKMPCPVLMEHIIMRPKPSSRPLQLLCRSVLPIKQLANEKTLLPRGGLWGFCCSCRALLWVFKQAIQVDLSLLHQTPGWGQWNCVFAECDILRDWTLAQHSLESSLLPVQLTWTIAELCPLNSLSR